MIWVRWVSQVAQGDEPALATLYDASSRLVYGWLCESLETLARQKR